MKVRPGVAAVLAGQALSADEPARAHSPEDARIVDSGLDALYHSDYDGARKIFDDAVAAHPGDPALSLGSAIEAWWRMENDFADPGSPEAKRFLDADKRAIDDARRASDKGGDAEAFT